MVKTYKGECFSIVKSLLAKDLTIVDEQLRGQLNVDPVGQS